MSKKSPEFENMIVQALINNEEVLTDYPDLVVQLINGQTTITFIASDSRFAFGFITQEKEISVLEICIYLDSNLGYYFRTYSPDAIDNIYRYIKLDIDES